MRACPGMVPPGTPRNPSLGRVKERGGVLQGAGRLIAGVLVTGGVGNCVCLPALRISPDLHAHEVFAPFTVVSLFVTRGVV